MKGAITPRFLILYVGALLLVAAAAQTLITPRQIRGGGTVTLMQCAGVTGTSVITNPDGSTKTITQDCTGLLYFDYVGADGREWKMIGTPPPPGMTIDPAHWSTVP